MNKEDNNKEMMQTFSMLMGEMMMNDKPVNKEDRHIINNAETAVIVTPFDSSDDIENEMILDFNLSLIKQYINTVEEISFTGDSNDHQFIEKLKSNLSLYEENHEKETWIIQSSIDEKVKKLISELFQPDSAFKFKTINLIKDNQVKVLIEQNGNQVTIFNLTEEDHIVIQECTSDYFSVSYY